MTTKEKLVHAVEALPDDATVEDAMERLLFLAKVERGIHQADAGQTISHSEVREWSLARGHRVWQANRHTVNLTSPSKVY